MSIANSTVVTNYTYTYQKKLQPKLDSNDDAVWSKDELQKYADEYNKATGTKLDVDNLMTKYANADGVIDYKSQQNMKSDDALGLNKLQELVTAAQTPTPSTSGTTGSTGSTSTSKAMTQDKKFAIYDAVNAFSYEYGGKLQPLLDKNSDGMWNKDELTSYAAALNKATGTKLDVDALITKYGNADGNIDPKNQTAMKDSDALKLSALKSAYESARTTPAVSLTNKEPTSSYKSQASGQKDFSVQDLLGSMSSSGKMSFSTGINRLDNQSALLNSFNMSSSSSMSSLLSSANSLNMYKAASGGNSQAVYAAMSGSLMNFAL